LLHELSALAPEAAEYFPLAHCVHVSTLFWAVPALYLPAPHALHMDVPTAFWYMPAVQALQPVSSVATAKILPALLLKRPVPHDSQLAPLLTTDL
jgi:hypothetical protein